MASKGKSTTLLCKSFEVVNIVLREPNVLLLPYSSIVGSYTSRMLLLFGSGVPFRERFSWTSRMSWRNCKRCFKEWQHYIVRTQFMVSIGSPSQVREPQQPETQIRMEEAHFTNGLQRSACGETLLGRSSHGTA